VGRSTGKDALGGEAFVEQMAEYAEVGMIGECSPLPLP
jgi:hypothetical protein